MDSRLINLACFLSFSSCFLLGFSQNPGEVGNVAQGGLEGLLGNAEGLGAVASSSYSGEMSCIQGLLACTSYFKSSSPPSSCCNAVKDMVSKDSQCLCSALDNPDILKSFNITQDDALNLQKACGVDLDISKCKAASSPDSSSTKPSPSSPSSSDGSSNNSISSESGAANLNHPHQFSGFAFIAFFSALVFLSF